MADEFMSNAANHNIPKVTVIPSEAKDRPFQTSLNNKRGQNFYERFLVPLGMTRI